MANYGYIVLDKPITQEELNKLAEEFALTVLQGVFSLEEWDDCWALVSPHSDRQSLCFWLDEYKYYDDDGNVTESKPCITVPHGHGSFFMDWVDISFDNFVGCKLKAKLHDDAFAESMEPIENKYPKVKDYALAMGMSEKGKKAAIVLALDYLDYYPELKERFWEEKHSSFKQ